jgi:Tol biopolymer transport system component
LRMSRKTLPGPSDYVQITYFADSATSPSLSPDGRMMTFIQGDSTFFGPGQVYVKALPDGEPVQLTHDRLQKMSPVFSPDASRIAYTIADPPSRWDTWIVSALGGEPHLWLKNAAAVSWIHEKQIMFSEITRAPYESGDKQ